MGLGGISIWQLLIILVIVFAIFGTKRLRNLGKDLGSGIKGFKEGLNSESSEEKPSPTEKITQDQTTNPAHQSSEASVEPEQKKET